jgi:hypothetical protein
MKSKISERLAEAIDACAPKNGKYAWIESISDIPTSNWKSALNGGQRPTVEMLESFCRSQPELAFYVVTGTLPQNGLEHIDTSAKQLNKMAFELKDILKKEPIDWSNAELNFAILKSRDGGFYYQNIDAGALNLAIQANLKKQLLRDFLKNEEIRLELEFNNELKMNDSAANSLTALKNEIDSISALRAYCASKK